MLAGLKYRATRQGLAGVIQPRRCALDDLMLADLTEAVAFALCFWMLHAVPDIASFLTQVRAAVRPGGWLLANEPKFHVKHCDFAAELELNRRGGRRLGYLGATTAIWGSLNAVFRKA
jgi:hypothetical protein